MSNNEERLLITKSLSYIADANTQQYLITCQQQATSFIQICPPHLLKYNTTWQMSNVPYIFYNMTCQLFLLACFLSTQVLLLDPKTLYSQTTATAFMQTETNNSDIQTIL